MKLVRALGILAAFIYLSLGMGVRALAQEASDSSMISIGKPVVLSPFFMSKKFKPLHYKSKYQSKSADEQLGTFTVSDFHKIMKSSSKVSVDAYYQNRIGKKILEMANASPMRVQEQQVKVPEINIKQEKTPEEVLAESFDLMADAGHLFNLSLRYPAQMGEVAPGRGYRIRDIPKYAHLIAGVNVGDGWFVQTGINTFGIYEDGAGAQVSDALMKFDPIGVINVAGYAPVFGLEKRVGKRLRFSVMYGASPERHGFKLYTITPTQMQIKVSAGVAF